MPANVVWMDHCYFNFEAKLEKEKDAELTRDVREGTFNFTDGLHSSGKLRTDSMLFTLIS